MGPLAQCAAAGTAGGGRPLDPATRGFFESRLNHDFGDVRVHTDASAARAANALGANAYVRGRDVVFDRSQFPIGAYTVSLPTNQFNERLPSLVSAVRKAAVRASVALGYLGTYPPESPLVR